MFDYQDSFSSLDEEITIKFWRQRGLLNYNKMDYLKGCEKSFLNEENYGAAKFTRAEIDRLEQ